MAQLLFVAAPQAATVGVPVASIGSMAPVGNTTSTADGLRVDFFIPLSGSATYGVDGGGLSADTCFSGCGGTLNMFLKFDPVTPGDNIVTLKFTDLDLYGVNDPSRFFESVEFFDSGAISLGKVKSASQTDPTTGLHVVTADFEQQLLEVLVPGVSSSPYWAKLVFKTSGSISGTNTVENLYASISPVPLPPALPLFALGLAVFAYVGRRRRV